MTVQTKNEPSSFNPDGLKIGFWLAASEHLKSHLGLCVVECKTTQSEVVQDIVKKISYIIMRH